MKTERKLRELSATEQLRTAIGYLRRPPVVLCIGSDRVTGDCIGPLVGYALSARVPKAVIVGTLNEPVTALNLADKVKQISKLYPNRKIIAIDSCLGDECDVGTFKIKKGSLRPGLACGNSLPKGGDVSVTATVAFGGSENLYSVRLSLVYGLALKIADAIEPVLTDFTK